MAKRPDMMRRFKAILAEEKRALRMKEHARKASELYAEKRFDEADRELGKAERLMRKR